MPAPWNPPKSGSGRLTVRVRVPDRANGPNFVRVADDLPGARRRFPKRRAAESDDAWRYLGRAHFRGTALPGAIFLAAPVFFSMDNGEMPVRPGRDRGGSGELHLASGSMSLKS